MKPIKEATWDAEAVRAKYDAYKTGMLTYDDYATYIVDYISKYVYSKVHKKGVDLSKFEDVAQQCMLRIVEKIPKYDPYIASPTSYFDPYIDQGVREETNPNYMATKHYQNLIIDMNKAIQATPKFAELGIVDCLDERVRTEELHDLLGGKHALTSLEAARAAASRAIVNIDETHENTIESTDYVNPLTAIIQNEESERIYNVISELSPLSQFICQAFLLAEHPYSKKKVLEYLKTPEAQQRFPGEIPNKVNLKDIEGKISRVKITLAEQLKEYGSRGEYRQVAEDMSFEQLDTQDADCMFNSGAFYLN
jgi:DNA-directed RNA polymerase specialized sigma24 family protein